MSQRRGESVLPVAAVVVLVGLGLSGCAPAQDPEPEPLTMTQAGTRYAEAICPVNEAWDALEVEIDRLRITVPRGESDTRRYSAALDRVAEASGAAAEQLADAAGAWPEPAETPIDRVVRSLADDAAAAALAAELPASEAIHHTWAGAEESASAADAARAALGLPDDPSAACAARDLPDGE